jgi:hypothetical protein
LPVVGCETISGRPLIFVESKDDVETLHLRGHRWPKLSHSGRYLANIVDDENTVNPVSLGDVVTPAKN